MSLQDSNNKLESEFNTHISLSKEWMTKHSNILKSIAENQRNISSILTRVMNSDSQRDTELIKYAHLGQYFLILNDNVEDLSDKLSKMENLLAFIHAKSTLHSIFSIVSMENMIHKLRNLYNKNEVIDLDLRDYYDVIKLGSYYTANQIVIVCKFPIASPTTYDLYKLPIVPNKYHEILIPSSPYIAIQGQNSMYLHT